MSLQLYESVSNTDVGESTPPPKWRTVRFWQELFLYFFFLSIAGHYLEVLWSFVRPFLTGGEVWYPARITFIPSGPPYGLGAIAIIVFVLPIVRKFSLIPLVVFFLNMFVTSIVEYICATALITIGGSRVWDYSHLPLNINGNIWIGGAALFGLAATVFLYFAYPFCEKLLEKLHENKLRFNIVFWSAFIVYALELVQLLYRGSVL
ncbi:MAG: putative ABC transporter permease [Actinobacteria bacterium]|nr:putative ABC transporter permease [Actinomycetota bacterium]